MSSGIVERSLEARRVDALCALVEACEDGAHVYQTAAQHAESPELSSLFASYGRQRDAFGQEIRAEVVRLGGKPPRLESVEGALRRGWLHVRSVLPGSKRALVEHCIRMEEDTLARYAAALVLPLPSPVAARIEGQYQEVQRIHLYLSSLRRSEAYAA